MTTSASPEAGGERLAGVSRRAAELAVTLVLLVLGALALWDSVQRGWGWTEEGPQSGYFPARLAVLLLIGALVAGISALRATDEVVLTFRQLGQVLRVLVPLTIYVAAIKPLGIYVASALFTIGFMIVIGRSRWWAALLTAVLVPLAFFILFEIEFGVPLPKGPLEALLGY